jgi:hypothetical protein
VRDSGECPCKHRVFFVGEQYPVLSRDLVVDVSLPWLDATPGKGSLVVVVVQATIVSMAAS